MKHAACEKCASAVGPVNVVGNILMIFIKGYMGVVGGSKGLIADAIHSSADLLATIIMIIGLKISGRKEDDKFPYGYGKAEYIVAIAIYLFLFVIALYFLFDATMAIIEQRSVIPSLIAAWGAVFSIAINELLFRHTICAGSQLNRPSMVAKAWESRTDVYSSIAVLIGIIGARYGLHFMDPLAAMAVGLLILRMSIEMVKDSVLSLMDKALEKDELNDVRKALKVIENIVNIRNIHTREMGSSLEFKIDLDVVGNISVSQGERIKKDVKETILNLLDRRSNVRIRLHPV